MSGSALGLLVAVSLARQAPTPTWEPPGDPNSARPSVLNHLGKWERRRVGLLSGLVVSAGVAVGGAIAAAAVARDDRECWVTCLVATPMIAFGSAGTAVTAPWVHHHDRWDDPRLRLSRPARTGPEAATIRRRQLWTAFGVFGGVAVAGLTSWVTPVFVPSCSPFYDRACTAAAVTGAAVLAVGGAGMLSTGTALILHRTHRHRPLEIDPSATSLSVRF